MLLIEASFTYVHRKAQFRSHHIRSYVLFVIRRLENAQNNSGSGHFHCLPCCACDTSQRSTAEQVAVISPMAG